MRESILMRVLFCKFHCPFICFCKPSATHLYNHGTLKLGNAPNASSLVVSGSDNAVKQFSGETSEIKEEEEEESIEEKQEPVIVLRSCIRKVLNGADSSGGVEKKQVQWVDNIGKELVEIKEFESRSGFLVCGDVRMVLEPVIRLMRKLRVARGKVLHQE